MQELNNKQSLEPISMEEYLSKRQRIREAEEHRSIKANDKVEKSSAYVLAELYV